MNVAELDFSNPYDPEYFRARGHELVDTLADYLSQVIHGESMSVYPVTAPDELTGIFSFDSEGGENEGFNDYIKRIVKYSNHLHHPKYIGHQVNPPLPLPVLIQLCTALLNNSSAIYEMGPVNMAMERNIVRYFGELIGYSDNFDGIFTHGGSIGNLTAMLSARQHFANHNIRGSGVNDQETPGYLVSEQSHYSIGRNIKIMGLGEESIIKIPCDSNFRIRTGLLEETKMRAEEKGIKVICVVANACSTATGSYDDLSRIADFCEKHKLWMHVDGAHGLPVLFSNKYRNRIEGAERADSIVIDFHKMLLVPSLNTLVMFKDAEKSYQTFSQKASYLFKKSSEYTWYNGALRTAECTKSAMGIVAFTALKYYGRSYFKEYIDSRYDLAIKFSDMIKATSDFELAAEPDANIVCFRYFSAGYDADTINRLNEDIRERLISEGTFYIVLAELNGKVWIRITIINPCTSEDTLKDLLSAISTTGEEILSGFQS